MDKLYKHRGLNGIAVYEVIKNLLGTEGVLHLKDTTCKHHGPNCEISVIPTEDGKGFEFKECLNETAKEYSYYHEYEPFFETEKEAWIWKVKELKKHKEISILEIKKRIETTEAVVKDFSVVKQKDIEYLKTENADFDTEFATQDGEKGEIVAKVVYKSGKIGFLTDLYNTEQDSDGYEIETDSIILQDKDGMLVANDKAVFPNIEMFNLSKDKKSLQIHENKLTDLKNQLKKAEERIKVFGEIIKNQDNLSVAEIKEMLK